MQDVLRTGKLREACRKGGFESARSVLSLYSIKIKADAHLLRISAADTLQAQCEYVDMLELDAKGKPEFMARQIFSEDEKLYFARGLKLYGDMGWPMSVKQIAALMQDAAQRKATRNGGWPLMLLTLFDPDPLHGYRVCVRTAAVRIICVSVHLCFFYCGGVYMEAVMNICIYIESTFLPLSLRPRRLEDRGAVSHVTHLRPWIPKIAPRAQVVQIVKH